MQIEHFTHNSVFQGRIDILEKGELNHWCDELNLQADELTEIVKNVGPNLEAVRDYLVRRSMMRERFF